MLINRWFVRCTDCLSIVAVEVQPITGDLCGACDGKIEVMGRVERDRLVTAEYQACACDARCQAARGPSCECACKGVNHGRSVTVLVREYAGLPRRVMVEGETLPGFPSKALTRATEYRQELARVAAARPGRVSAVLKSGAYLPERADYSAAMSYRRLVAAAREARTHNGRMKILRSIQESGIVRIAA